MQTMKIMTLRRNKKITQHANTGMHFYMQCRYPQTHKNHQKEYFMLHIKQNLNDELMLKTIIASLNAV